MTTCLEHANMTVPDTDATIAFLRTVEPSFHVRHDGTSEGGGCRRAHIGSNQFYVALQEPHLGSNAQSDRRPYKDYGVNHLAWVVEDFGVVTERLEKKGYQKGIPVEPHPHRKRAYYFDTGRFEWEIVEYLSDTQKERNGYA